MVLLHKITRNIIDSHPVTLMILFRNETILRPSYISGIKKVKKDEKWVKDSQGAGVKVTCLLNIQFWGKCILSSIDDKQCSNFNQQKTNLLKKTFLLVQILAKSKEVKKIESHPSLYGTIKNDITLVRRQGVYNWSEKSKDVLILRSICKSHGESVSECDPHHKNLTASVTSPGYLFPWPIFQ